MLLFASTLKALAPLFGLILLGYGLKRARVLSLEHVPLMNGIVINATLPALVLHSLATAPSLARATAVSPILLFLCEAVVIGLALLMARLARLDRRTTGALMLVAAFGNTGFLGYPVCISLMPAQLTAAVLIDQLGMTPSLLLMAPILGARYGSAATTEREAALRVLRSPIFLSVVFGLLIRAVPHPVSAVVTAGMVGGWLDIADRILVYLGQGTTPLVLLALGVALRPSAVGPARVPVAIAAVLKLGVCPLLMLLLCRICGLHGGLEAIAVVQATMPAAVMSSVLSATNDLDGDFAVAGVFVTTVLSAVAIPFWATIVR